MNTLKKIKSLIKGLDTKELRALHNWIGDRLPPAVVYQQNPTKFGCKKCKEGEEGHGLYWYAYFTYQNKTYLAYVGKEKKEIDPYEILRRKGVIR